MLLFMFGRLVDFYVKDFQMTNKMKYKITRINIKSGLERKKGKVRLVFSVSNIPTININIKKQAVEDGTCEDRKFDFVFLHNMQYLLTQPFIFIKKRNH